MATGTKRKRTRRVLNLRRNSLVAWTKEFEGNDAFRGVDPVRYQRWVRLGDPQLFSDEPSQVIVIEGDGDLQLSSGIERMGRAKKRNTGLEEFLGLIPGKKDAVAIQREMRRERR